MRSFIDSDLRYGLGLTEEAQLLYGNGVSSNLTGLVPNATAYNAATIAGYTPANKIDEIAVAVLQVSLANHRPNGIAMHPSDWMETRLLKDGDGKYLIGAPQADPDARLFGLRVVPSLSMTRGTFLVGAFNEVGTLYDRMSTRIEAGYVNDDFTRNMVTILAEKRLAMAIKYPAAIVHGTFT